LSFLGKQLRFFPCRFSCLSPSFENRFRIDLRFFFPNVRILPILGFWKKGFRFLIFFEKEEVRKAIMKNIES